MPSYRRWLPVLSIMTVAMVLCGLAMAQFLTKPAPPPIVRGARESALALLNGVGLMFALYCGAALVVTHRWHRVGVAARAVLRALLSVGLSFPLLFWGASFAAGLVVRMSPIKSPRAEDHLILVMIYAAMITASAAGARWVAAVLARLTGAIDRRLRAMMIGYGALWPFLQPLARKVGDHLAFDWLFRDQLSVGALFAWQLPIGLASAAWFLRARLPEAGNTPTT